MNFDWGKVYTYKKDWVLNKKTGKTTKINIPAEYLGGVNFSNGIRTCTLCKGKMVRYPLGHPYVNTRNGKILVEVDYNGQMFVKRGEPPYIWACQSCNTAITPKNQVKPLTLNKDEEIKEVVDQNGN